MDTNDAGHAAAFDELVRPMLDRLLRTSVLLTGNLAAAEDLVQTTLTRLYARRDWSRLDHPEHYLRKMITNEFLSTRRRRSSTEISLAEVPEPALTWVDRDPALRVDLFRMLARLSHADRAVLVLRYWEDLSVAETAALLECSPGAVRTRSSRALHTLRQLHPRTDVAASSTRLGQEDPR